MTRLYKVFAYICLPALSLAWTGCSKSLDIAPPVSNIISSEAFANDISATSVMTGLYSTMTANTGLTSGVGGISLLQGLAADELTNYLKSAAGATLQEFYTNTYNIRSIYFWNEIYKSLYIVNLTIENVPASKGLSDGVRAQLLGEARFMRAFLYFYAVNCYGAVPLALSTDYRVNNTLSRAQPEDVYKQIVTDLKEAQALMGNAYFSGTTAGSNERARPNKAAASALLARVYLYLKDWTNAEIQATSVISNATYQPETDLNKTFTTSSRENIWYLQTVNPSNFASLDGQTFILNTTPGISIAKPVAMSSFLLESFEAGDDRRNKWVMSYIATNGATYYYPFKYQKNAIATPEGIIALRLSEQYLIRAEARAQLGNITGANSAASDLNVIRTKALLPETTATEKDAMLDAIAAERRIELFTEWGHRWFDLIRTGHINEVMSVITPQKGGIWNPAHQVLPIPYDETQINPNIKQNPGYSN